MLNFEAKAKSVVLVFKSNEKSDKAIHIDKIRV